MKTLNQEFFENLNNAMKEFKTLSDGVKFDYHFSNKVKGLYHVEAPHYLIIKSQNLPSEQVEVGYFFEQLILWFDSNDIGSVWLGASKDFNADKNDKTVAVIAFGKANDSVHRNLENFSRKSINAITNTPEDVCIEAVRLAPSGMNTQPWFFEKLDDKIFVYKKKLSLPISLLYHKSDIDMGIALCHYSLACREFGQKFSFVFDTKMPAKNGYEPFGIIHL